MGLFVKLDASLNYLIIVIPGILSYFLLPSYHIKIIIKKINTKKDIHPHFFLLLIIMSSKLFFFHRSMTVSLVSLIFLYADRFYGEVNVSDITYTSAGVKWLEAPGAISGYRVEVKSEKHNWTETLTSNLTTQFQNLTAGTKYTVFVFPIKCGRDLNPQTTYFYSRKWELSFYYFATGSSSDNCE